MTLSFGSVQVDIDVHVSITADGWAVTGDLHVYWSWGPLVAAFVTGTHTIIEATVALADDSFRACASSDIPGFSDILDLDLSGVSAQPCIKTTSSFPYIALD